MDMGQADRSLRFTPSSKEHHEAVFARHRERMRQFFPQPPAASEVAFLLDDTSDGI